VLEDLSQGSHFIMIPLYFLFISFTLARGYKHLLQDLSEYIHRLTSYHLGRQLRAWGLSYQRGGQVALFHTPPGEVVIQRYLVLVLLGYNA